MNTDRNCMHKNISVTYMHPHGDVAGVEISDLISLPLGETRPVMTLAEPVCKDCGARLTPRDLGDRVAEGGDLFDSRFRFVW